MSRLNDLINEMDDVSKSIRKLQQDTEKREMTPEEETRYTNSLDAYEKIQGKVEEERKFQQMEEKRQKYAEAAEDPLTGQPGEEGRTKVEVEEKRSAAFQKFLKRGEKGLSSEERGLLVSDDSQGGYLAAPAQFVSQLIQAVDDLLFIRQGATTYQLAKSVSLGAPSLDTDMDDADWTSEIAAVTEDTGLKLGKRELKPNLLSKLVKVSMRLVNSGVTNIVDFINERIAYKIALTQEKAFLTGDGNNKPLGLLVASDDGIPTSRDVNSGHASQVTADGIIDIAYSLKEQYLRNSQWITTRSMIKAVYKLKGTDNHYIWQPGLAGAPPTLMGRPYNMSEHVPDVAANAYAAILGDLSYYWIADAMNMAVQVLNELYAATNQIGYIGRLESDGMPVLSEAFSRLKIAA